MEFIHWKEGGIEYWIKPDQIKYFYINGDGYCYLNFGGEDVSIPKDVLQKVLKALREAMP